MGSSCSSERNSVAPRSFVADAHRGPPPHVFNVNGTAVADKDEDIPVAKRPVKPMDSLAYNRKHLKKKGVDLDAKSRNTTVKPDTMETRINAPTNAFAEETEEDYANETDDEEKKNISISKKTIKNDPVKISPVENPPVPGEIEKAYTVPKETTTSTQSEIKLPDARNHTTTRIEDMTTLAENVGGDYQDQNAASPSSAPTHFETDTSTEPINRYEDQDTAGSAAINYRANPSATIDRPVLEIDGQVSTDVANDTTVVESYASQEAGIVSTRPLEDVSQVDDASNSYEPKTTSTLVKPMDDYQGEYTTSIPAEPSKDTTTTSTPIEPLNEYKNHQTASEFVESVIGQTGHVKKSTADVVPIENEQTTVESYKTETLEIKEELHEVGTTDYVDTIL